VTATPGDRFHGWRIARVLAISTTVSYGVLYYAFAALLVPMQDDLGFSTATLTGAFSLSLGVAGIAAIPVGRWVDRHGARLLMSLGSVTAALLVLAWSRVETATGLYLVFAGIGAASAAVLYEPAFAVIVRWFRAQRAKALLSITLVAGFASTIFIPTTAALEQAIGWRQALWVLSGLLAAATVLPLALVLRRDPADLGLHPDGADHDMSTEPVSAAARPRLGATARSAIRNQRFWLLTIAYAANTLAVTIIGVHLIPFLREHGHSPGFAAVATGGLGVLSVTGRVAVTGAIRRWSTGHVTAAVFGVQALGCLVLLTSGSTVAGAAAGVLLFGVGFGVGTITRPELTANAFGTSGFATISALIGLALTLAKTAGPVTAGLLRTITGGYAVVLTGVSVACLIAAAAVWRTGHDEPRQSSVA
jgi:sugar phosphate permease